MDGTQYPIPNSNSPNSKTQYPISNSNSYNPIAIAIAIVRTQYPIVQKIFRIFKVPLEEQMWTIFLPPEAKPWTVLTARGKNFIVRIENLRMNDQADSDRAVKAST